MSIPGGVSVTARDAGTAVCRDSIQAVTCAALPVDPTVAERFDDMLAQDAVAVCKISNRAAGAQQPMRGPGGEAEAFDRLFEQLTRVLGKRCDRSHYAQ